MRNANNLKGFLLIVLAGAMLWTAGIQAEPKNVIFLIGDGMGPEQVLAAVYYTGGALSFEGLPYSGEVTTYSANNAVTDSAAAATALATGVKVNNDVISVAIPGDQSELETLLEYYQALGRRAGLVTTAYVTHATPAAFGAHENSRSNYPQIAADYLTQTRPNVILGGNSYMGGAAGAGYTIVSDYASMIALDTETVTLVNGQFGTGYMPYEYDGLGSLPHLSEMTATALAILDTDPDGFFLMVEGGRIDHACHDNDLERSIHETIEFSTTVQVALDWAAANDPTYSNTLILVTADHETGGLTVLADNGPSNYPTVSWSSTGHTAANVPVYAIGLNAELIGGVMDNTEMFGVVTAGSAASNPTPSDGVADVDIEADLGWNAGSGAAWHNLYFGTDPDPRTQTPVKLGAAITTYDPGTLSPATAYYWAIDELDGGDQVIAVGETWTFTTAAAPTAATNPNPGDGAIDVDGNADLSWTAGSNVTSHDVHFDTVDPPAFVGNQPGTTYDPGQMEYNTTYYWRIDEVGPGGVAAGTVWSFTTGDVPPATANSDIPVGGTVGGSYVDTQASDDTYETITERESGGKPSGRHSWLEHKWTFSVPGGDTVKFYVEAHKTASTDGDDFILAYSTDDSSYTDMVTITKTADNDSYQSYSLPSSLSGTVYVRVVDTDQTPGNKALDTVSIDHMYIECAGPGEPDEDPPTPNPATWAIAPVADSETAISMTATTGSDASGPVEYYFDEISDNPGGTDSGWQTSPSYTDTGLNPSTQYTYTVQMRDTAPTPNIGAASAPANATTLAGCTPTDIHIEAVVCGELGGCGPAASNGQATVVIYDDCGNPVVNALVDGAFSGDFDEAFYDVLTDGNGEALFTTSGCVKKPSFTFTVIGVDHATLPHDGNDDLVTECGG